MYKKYVDQTDEYYRMITLFPLAIKSVLCTAN